MGLKCNEDRSNANEIVITSPDYGYPIDYLQDTLVVTSPGYGYPIGYPQEAFLSNKWQCESNISPENNSVLLLEVNDVVVTWTFDWAGTQTEKLANVLLGGTRFLQRLHISISEFKYN